MELEDNIHQRVLKLRDAALGSRKSVSVNSALASVSYECVVDSLLALYAECSSEHAGLARDKNVARFISKYESAVKRLNDLRLTSDDFSVKAVIGRGHFGEVQVVHEKSTGDVYAMKVMKKSHILQQADAAFFLEERDIMAWASSPWLTSLHYAFQDSTHLYLVMDFHPGGDLLSVTERYEGGMSEPDARFYLSEIALGLHDLHQLGFVHRDIKPENVLITRSGHIKLVDFGSAARLGPQGKVLESRLPVGTPEYIAPEVLTSLDCTADYGVCCDWWSLGIIAFELLYDTTPFSGGSTTETYGNIMNYKKSLSFPDGVEVSDALRGLVSQLLTDPDSRLGFAGLRTHAFFSSVDWDRLQHATPPYIPDVSTPDDTANFDEFETQRDSEEGLFSTPHLSRGQHGFSGRSLPFVGFTFTRMDSVNLDLTDSEDPAKRGGVVGRRSSGKGVWGRGRGRGGKRGAEGVGGRGEEQEAAELKRVLEASQKELKELRERKSSLERECVIYQTQLEDYHRKLEIEKVERRHSDCQALQLLGEVREQGKIAQQLREGEARSTCDQLSKVIEQLEQDRGVASKRARRLQDELQRVQQERDAALKKISEYKAKVTEVKQHGRKDISALQAKLAKVTKDSLAKAADMQDRLTEAHARFSESSKRVQEVESERRKLEFSLQQAQLDGSISSSEASRDLTKRLEETEDARTKAEKAAADLKHQLEVKDQENSSLNAQCKQLSQQVKELEGQWQSANSRQEQLEAVEWDLKTQLGEASREREKAVAARREVQEKLTHLEKLVSELQSAKQSLEDQIKSQRVSPNGASVVVKQEGRGEREEEEREELQTRLSARDWELAEAQEQLKAAKKAAEKMQSQHKENLRSVQAQLSETSNLYVAQGDKLREVRRARMELDQENTNLKTALSRTKAEVKRWERKFAAAGEELDSLRGVRETVKALQKEVKSVNNSNKDVKHDVEVSQSEREEEILARREAEATLRNTRKEMEAQELSMTLLQKKLSSVEEELLEVRGAMEEGRGREGEWRENREHLQSDLQAAETRVEAAYSEVEKEKAMRATLEQRLSDTLSSLEKTVVAHSEEQQRLAEQLSTQKQLASKYSDRMSQLEKESRLRGLELREVQKDLETEKSLSSKLYDDLHSLGREHGKLKAAHLKMLQETQQKESELSQEAVTRERTMEQQRVAAEAHVIQKTKLQATIAQQTKLIDFLQNPSPPSRSRIKLRGFKLNRKSRDPAKEMTEWKKIKGLAAKPTSRGTGVVAEMSSPTVSLQKITSSPSVPPSSSRFSLASISSVSSQLTPGTSQGGGGGASVHVVHLPSTQKRHGSPIGSEVSPKVTQYFSVQTADDLEATPTSPTRLSVKRLSVDLRRQPAEKMAPEVKKAASLKKTGKKRGLEVSSVTSYPTQQPSRLGIEHNIPHKFVLKSAPLHKTYTCASCKTTIKAMQKFVKCSYCGQACHPKCSNHIPNNCGLPAELVDFDLQQPSSAKKLKREEQGEVERRGEKREVGTGEKEEGATGGREGVIKTAGSASVVRKWEETIKMGRVHVPRGDVKSECWLILTESSLKCYDRHPAGVTRKPLNSFSWANPQNLIVVLRNVDTRPMSYLSPAKYQHLLFAVEQHAMSGIKQAVFVAETLEDKEGWVVAIETAITRKSGPPHSQELENSEKTRETDVIVSPVRSSRRLATRHANTSTDRTSSPDSSSVV